MHDDQKDDNGFVGKVGLGLDNGHNCHRNTDHYDRMMYNLLSRVDVVSSCDQRVDNNSQLDSREYMTLLLMLLVSTTLILLLLQVQKSLGMEALLT